VQSGAADAGLIALSLALAPPLASGRRFDVPADLHPPIEQGGLVLRSARHQRAARALRDLLLSEEGQALLARWGFANADGRPRSAAQGAGLRPASALGSSHTGR
jgi:molybdate transport system substrate-binding protein